MKDDTQEILESLKPLFEKARKEKLIFECNYQGIIFFPDDLEKAQEKGRFIWGPVNWSLIDPSERLKGMKNNTIEAQKEYERFLAKVNKYKKA